MVIYNDYYVACREADIPYLTYREWRLNGQPSFEQYKADRDRRVARVYQRRGGSHLRRVK